MAKDFRASPTTSGFIKPPENLAEAPFEARAFLRGRALLAAAAHLVEEEFHGVFEGSVLRAVVGHREIPNVEISERIWCLLVNLGHLGPVLKGYKSS